MIQKERLAIGIDPGLASTGYGLVGMISGRLVYHGHGVITTPSTLLHQERLMIIWNSLNDVLDRYNPQEAGMETLYFAKNVSSAMGVAEARGVVTLALGLRKITLGEYTPHAIKQAVVGMARAEKSQVQESVKILLGLKDIPKPDHASDALAAAITKLHTFLVKER